MLENNDILFDDYLNHQLSADERIAFEQRLVNDIDFKQAFDIHVQTIDFIVAKGEQDIRNELNSIYDTHKNEIDNTSYKPTINGNEFSIFSFLFKLMFISFVVLGISTVLIRMNKFPIHHPKIDAYKNWTQEIQQKYFMIKVDTVYYEIQSTEVKAGDTIIDFPDKRIIKSHSTSDTISKNKVIIKSTFKTDTIKIKPQQIFRDGGNAAIQGL